MERHLKGAFVTYGVEHQSPSVIVFQFNPETLIRSISVPEGQPAGSPESAREVISFTMLLDAVEFSDQHEDPDVAEIGLLPTMSALEGLLIAAEDEARSAPSTTLFCWGPHRIVPVHLRSLVINETDFSATLAPVRATVDIVMDVPGSAEVRQARQNLATRLPGSVPEYIARILK